MFTPMRLARKAIRNYTSPYVSKELNRRNQRAWIAAVRRLGDRWLLAVPVERVSS